MFSLLGRVGSRLQLWGVPVVSSITVRGIGGLGATASGVLLPSASAAGVKETLSEKIRVPPVESPLIAAFVNNIMKDGKKAIARRIVASALGHIGSAPSSSAYATPHLALAAAVEKAEPLFKVVSSKRGAKSLQTPKPLTERQRSESPIEPYLTAKQSNPLQRI
ncbi:hypothetical protein HK100_009138, partial [Physocladia obscura]